MTLKFNTYLLPFQNHHKKGKNATNIKAKQPVLFHYNKTKLKNSGIYQEKSNGKVVIKQFFVVFSISYRLGPRMKHT